MADNQQQQLNAALEQQIVEQGEEFRRRFVEIVRKLKENYNRLKNEKETMEGILRDLETDFDPDVSLILK